MFQDIVFPQNNEKEFVKIALKLDIKALIFVYEFKDVKTFENQKRMIEGIKEVKADIGLLVNEKTINKLPFTDAYIFSKTPSRALVESKKSYILFDFELQDRSDFLHHRNSGINQVLCQEMKEKEKMLGFSFSTLLNSRNPQIILGRMQQNARFAKKYKLNAVFASFAKNPYEMRAKHEIDAFKRILGF